MGLDGVELILAVEDRFKIAISDADAGGARTVGELVELVHARLRHSVEEPCPSQHGFYVVRRQLMSRFALSRSAIRPEARLDDLIPMENRRARWASFVKELAGENCALAALVLPRRLHWIVVFLVPAIVFLAIAKWLPLPFCWLGLFPAIFAIVAADRIASHWKTQFPAALSTVGDLVPLVSPLESGVWSEERVFETIRELTVEILGVKPEQVKMESLWVEDLGMD